MAKKKNEINGLVQKEYYLEHTTEGHNKFYKLQLVEVASGPMIETSWGRIGGTPSTKNQLFATKDLALAEMNKILHSKMAKGYKLKSETKKIEDKKDETTVESGSTRFSKMIMEW